MAGYPYAEIFDPATASYSLPGGLLPAISRRESNFSPTAVGDGGCSCGLMQLNWCGGAGAGYTCGQLQDPSTAIWLAAAYLRSCADAFPGDWWRAVAAYRQGIGGVQQNGPIDQDGYLTDIMRYWAEYGGSPPPSPGGTTAPAGRLLVAGLIAAVLLGWVEI